MVIVCMAKCIDKTRYLYNAETVNDAENINPYLAAAPNFFTEKRSQPISTMLSSALYAPKPADGGNLQIKTKEDHDLAERDPIAKKYLRRSLGATELINGKQRWCLWLESASPEDIANSSILKERVDGCREFRLSSKKKQTREAVETPQLFAEMREIPDVYLCIPRHFSGERAVYC